MLQLAAVDSSPARAAWLRRFLTTSAAVCSLAAGSSAFGACAGSGEFTLLAYAGIFKDNYMAAVVEPFMKECPNIKVNYFTIGNSAKMLGGLRAQKTDPQVDVVIFDSSVALVGNKEALLAKLDPTEVTNIADLNPMAIIQPGYGTAVTFDHLVIVYDTRDVKPAPTSLSVLWEPQYSGKIALSATPNIQGLALTVMADKMAGGTDHTKSVDKGMAKLAELGPHVQTFEPTPDGYTMVLNDNVEFATGWNARAQLLSDKSNGRLGVMLPAEGSVFQINSINLVAGAKNAQAGKTFINYALSPEAQARFSERMFYAPVNTKAKVSDAALSRTALAKMERMIPVDWGWMATVRNAWNKRWRREVISAK